MIDNKDENMDEIISDHANEETSEEPSKEKNKRARKKADGKTDTTADKNAAKSSAKKAGKKDSEKDNPHKGHRSRMRKRFFQEGLENFYDHEIIEVLLYYVFTRCDTNGIAHRLLDKFGSLSGLLSAPAEALRDCNLNENTVMLLKLIPAICSRYLIDLNNQSKEFSKFTDATTVGQYIFPYFIDKRNEESTLLFLMNAAGKKVYCDFLSKGIITGSDVSIKKITQLAVQYKASSAVFAHNHPSGMLMPSDNDIIATVKIREALSAIGVKLLDHILIIDNEFYPLSKVPECSKLFNDRYFYD